MTASAAYKFGMAILTAVLLPCLLLSSAHIQKRNFFIVSSGKHLKLEERCGAPTAPAAAAIFLHGSGGPQSENLPYLDEVQDLAKQGYCVYILHYLDATGGSPDSPEKHYSIWVQAVADTSNYIADNKKIPIGRIALVGYSLGASIALASAAKNPHFGAVVEFSGSLPDEYVPLFKASPPLLIIHGQDDASIPVINAQQVASLCASRKQVCGIELFPKEGHAFSIGAIITSKHKVEAFLNEHIQL
jgi:dienelactone hydrolase